MSSSRQFMNLYRHCFHKSGCPLAKARVSPISRGALARLWLSTSFAKREDPRLRYEDMYGRLLQVYTGLDGTVSVKDFQAVSGLVLFC